MNSEKIPYLFVTGASYTGSTLLAFLTNSHPEMMSISECEGPDSAVIIDRFRCSCGALFLECPFFLELERRIRELGSSFDLRNWRVGFHLSRSRMIDIPLARPLRNVPLESVRDRVVPLLPGYKRAIRGIARRNEHLVQAALAISGKRVFVDAQKDSMRIKFLRDIDRFDLRVVHLVRDARAGTASFMRNLGLSVEKAAKAWRVANMNSERARRYVSPDRWTRVTYDELCADPQGVVDRIAEFIGVERAPLPSDIYQSEHHIVGHSMRFAGTGSVEKNERWRESLSERDLAVVRRVAGDANRTLGNEWP